MVSWIPFWHGNNSGKSEIIIEKETILPTGGATVITVKSINVTQNCLGLNVLFRIFA